MLMKTRNTKRFIVTEMSVLTVVYLVNTIRIKLISLSILCFCQSHFHDSIFTQAQMITTLVQIDISAIRIHFNELNNFECKKEHLLLLLLGMLHT